MPAYYNISLTFCREDIHENLVQELHDWLKKAGLQFAGGFWEAKNNTLEEILEWNQQRLEQNFKLGFTEHCSHDYKQSLYEYGEFSKVRGFWMNQYPEDAEFTYELIVPESEVLVEEKCGYGHMVYQEEALEKLKALACKLWEYPLIRTIQTGIEGDDATIAEEQLKKGELPSMYPFAIVPRKYVNQLEKEQYIMESLQWEAVLIIR